MSADRWPDDVRLSDLEPLFTCTACGLKGADARGNFNWAGEQNKTAARNKKPLEPYSEASGYATPGYPVPTLPINRRCGRFTYRCVYRRKQNGQKEKAARR